MAEHAEILQRFGERARPVPHAERLSAARELGPINGDIAPRDPVFFERKRIRIGLVENLLKRRMIETLHTRERCTDEQIQIPVHDGPGRVVLVGQILLGPNAKEPLVLGNKLKELFNNHVHPTGVGPSEKPVEPMTGDHLSSLSSTE